MGVLVRRFASRHPFAFSVLVTLAVSGLDLVSRAVFPRVPVGNIEKLPQDAFEPPVGLGLIFSDMRSTDTLFWVLATVLALGLLVWTDWLGEAGFNRMSQWRNLRLLLFPLLVCVLTLSGGLFGSGPASLVSAFLTALIAAFGEEIVFRGLLWRALAPAGPVRAVILTSLLSGLLVLGMTATEGPWPEAVRLTVLTLCGGFTYGALRWRTTSIWPVILVHTAFAFAVSIATLGTFTYPLMMLLSTLGFVAYGLYLLRNPRVRADGGLIKPAPSRVR
jgi:membrane protease YdiL (CAAX protease family)